MKGFSTLAALGAAFVLTAATAASAAPCRTDNAPDKPASANATPSSRVEPPTTGNTTPGARSESPGTVGGMQNPVGDKATSAQDVARQSRGEPTVAQQGQMAQGSAGKPDC